MSRLERGCDIVESKCIRYSKEGEPLYIDSAKAVKLLKAEGYTEEQAENIIDFDADYLGFDVL